jgi:hypothetical protein
MKLSRSSTALIGATILALVLLFVLLVPVISYSVSFSIPNNYGGDAFSICSPLANNESQFQNCLRQNAIPPVVIDGRAPLAYSLAGYGTPPLPWVSLITQGNSSALVYFRGASVAYAEGLFQYSRTPVLLEQTGFARISNIALTPDANGLLNFSAVISLLGTSYSGNGIKEAAVYFDYPGYGSNNTVDGVVWHTPLHDMGCNSSQTGIFACSLLIEPNSNLKVGTSYPLTLVLRGSAVFGQVVIHTTTDQAGHTISLVEQNQTTFVFLQRFEVEYPGSGPNSAWVQAFIHNVNNQRGSAPLTEDPSLDAFAATRFQTAVSNYTMSDFGFDSQAASFFAGTGRIDTEEILYPQTFAPVAFASYLQQNAPSHWGALIDRAYTKYGFHLGYGPVVEFATGCPVNEITARNVNITQLAIANGCKYEIRVEVWMLLILSS